MVKATKEVARQPTITARQSIPGSITQTRERVREREGERDYRIVYPFSTLCSEYLQIKCGKRDKINCTNDKTLQLVEKFIYLF